uniref:Calmodulin n=1 Tax=Grammatophora oceanica TaxID=210454 RepID=A0A7S1VSE2_9STRA|mmetsp:Transcript_5817/g.8278  ORF Transcript_5817/g.8278 Transcript_5817/m.8278 type:complete len:143 (+) Transcript_5817:90-518(+)|eukprot:CAMPEP_0194036720 /NCGR_PEP_ID=MMETSP0009_2-20130614/9087_1 /TAXON_ID=210454 /ORGANISM="Grammatophora oceanica, Strain CCMP 410" /LENGTH=142 /DNA_ID=CAMNT_0038678591 /DNA_START=90 /DNA_END=518 /DNA_ORIENTATION=-
MGVVSKATEESEIREFFGVLDEQKVGLIDLAAFRTLWLGMGYGRVTKSELKAKVGGKVDNISLQEILAVLRKHRRKESFAKPFFDLIAAGTASNGVITPEDLQRLARDAGDSVTLDQARAMMQPNEEWTKQDLESLMSGSHF